MTSPQSVPTPATEPIYHSRKEARLAREACLVAGVQETTLDTPSAHNVHTGETVGSLTVPVVDDRVEGALPAKLTSVRVSRFKGLPVAASIVMTMFLTGVATFEVAEAQSNPAASSSITQDKPADTASMATEPAVPPVAESPAPVVTPKPAPTPMTEGDIPVAQRKDFNQSYGKFSTKFATHDLRETDYLTADYKRPTNTPEERSVRLNGVVDTLDEKGRYITAHYARTEMFGEVGVVGVTGERGNGDQSPFTRIDEFVQGDEVSIETQEGTYVYALIGQTPEVPKGDQWVKDAIHDDVFKNYDAQGFPLRTGEKVERALVITTCGLIRSGWRAGWGNDDTRVISYFEFKSFTPKA